MSVSIAPALASGSTPARICGPIQAQLGADGPGRFRVVTGQQEDAGALAAKLVDDLAGVRLEGVGQGDGTHGAAVDRDPEHGARLVLPRLRGRLDRPLIDA